MNPERRNLRKLILALSTLMLLSILGGAGLRLPGRYIVSSDSAVTSDAIPDIVYLVAGASDQDRRLKALVGYTRDLAAMAPAFQALPEIWIGNDFEIGPWSRSAARNLTRAEWAKEKFHDMAGEPAASRFQLLIVPGRAWGTDGEMAALAELLHQRYDFANGVRQAGRHVAVVTCPTHARRVVARLRARLPETMLIQVIPANDRLTDWMPWVTIVEWGKIIRDGAGWSEAPLISRQWYQYRASERNTTRAWRLPLLLLLTLALPVYAWFLFPLLLRRFATRFPQQPASTGVREQTGLALVLIAAHNEETDIGPRLLNLGLQDLPKDQFIVYVGVDGATDGTADAARAAAARVAADGLRVEIQDEPPRRGKVATLKRLVAHAMREHPNAAWLVFTDANTRFEPQALRFLLEPFADQRVGGVCGRLLLEQPKAPGKTSGGGHRSESRYWSWENRLKSWESRLDSCLGANGAIYALRAHLFPDTVPDNTIVDDLVIGMKVREQGCRMLYQPRAVAHETMPESAAEWRRRVRIGAGDFQALRLCGRCLLPRYGWFAWCFFSHKILRWLTPHLLLAAWGLAVAGWLRAGSQGWCYALVALGGPLVVLTARLGRHRRTVDYLITMQVALLAGSIQWLRGGLRGTWDRTPR